MNDPLAAYEWGQLYERYDLKCASSFARAMSTIGRRVDNFDALIREETDRNLYYAIISSAGQNRKSRNGVTIQDYLAMTFWKLSSTSTAVTYKLAADEELQKRTTRSLASVCKILPGELRRDDETVLAWINAIGAFRVFGMTSATSFPMRTTFLHFLYPNTVPIFDQMVLRSVGFSKEEAKSRVGDICTLRRYLLHAWLLSDKYENMHSNFRESSIRVNDMALWTMRS